MSYLIVNRADKFSIEIDSIASDKSISHRCAIFSLLCDKPSVIENYLPAEDTMNTLKIVELLGAKVEKKDNIITITPPLKLNEPVDILDCGNSGTAMRLFMGFLASKDGFFVLHGDKYLASRPMKRVADPLRSIGASIDGREGGNLSPIAISGRSLKGFDYVSPIASAQVKSAMILASLNSDEPSFYKESHLSRDHTERMLRGMGVNIVDEGDRIKITPPTSALKPLNLRVPSDPSSGFFFAVAAAITPNSKVTLKNLSLNPTRIEAYKVLEKMGAKISYDLKEEIYEPIGDIVIEYAPLNGVVVEDNIAWLIDELPALSIAMAVAKGASLVKNAKELRVKESDRIKTVVDNLNICGIKTNEYEDGYEVVGGKFSVGTKIIDSFGDHRIAMSFAIAGLISKIKVKDVECIETSFPNFVEILESMTHVESEVEIGD